MFDWFSRWITKENITLFIAIAGFVMSFMGCISRRKSLSVRILRYRIYGECEKYMYAYIAFENRSQLPIAITRLSLLMDGKTYDAIQIPQRIFERKRTIGKEVISRTEEYSTAIPIQLQSLGACTALIFFDTLPALTETQPTHLTFLIGTNRGKAMKTLLSLPPEPDVLNKAQ